MKTHLTIESLFGLFFILIYFIGCSEDSGPELVAIAGLDRIAHVGQEIDLDASQSRSSSTIKYRWKVVASPNGSVAVIADPVAAKTIFIGTLEGEYLVSLVVIAGTDTSQPDTLQITLFSETSQELFPNSIGNWWKYLRQTHSGTVIDTVTVSVASLNGDGSKRWMYNSTLLSFEYGVVTNDSTVIFYRLANCDYFIIKLPLVLNNSWNNEGVCSRTTDASDIDQIRQLNLIGGIFNSFLVQRFYGISGEVGFHYESYDVVPNIGIVLMDLGSDGGQDEVWQLLDYHLVN